MRVNIRAVIFCSWRFFRSWRRQGILVTVMVAGSIALLVFSNGMINSLIEDNLNRALGTSIPHVLVEDPGICSEMPNCYERVMLVGFLRKGSETIPITLIGLDPVREELKPEDGGLTLSDSLCEELGLRRGGEVTLITPNGEIRARVVGTYNSSLALDPRTILTTLNYCKSELGIEPNVAVIKLKDPERADEVVKDLRERGYRAKSWKELAKNLLQVIEGDKVYASILSATIAAVVGLSILNITLMMVESRKREIGVLKSVGLTTTEIFLIYSGVSLVQALIGYALGMIVALAGSRVLSTVTVDLGTFTMRVSAKIGPVDALYGFIFALLVSLAASAFSSLRAARVKPAEVMRFG